MGDESAPETPAPSGWPRRQVYFITVEWLDDAHRPESPERLAQVLRHAIEHGHGLAQGAAPTRFIVRVKSDNLAAEAEGALQPRAPHQHD